MLNNKYLQTITKEEISNLPLKQFEGRIYLIESFSEIKNSVIGDDVNIGPSSIVQDSVIAGGCVIKGRFTACSGEVEVKINGEYCRVNVGAMLGAGCNLENSVIAQPGVIMGNYSQVQAMKLVSGKLPDRSSVF